MFAILIAGTQSAENVVVEIARKGNLHSFIPPTIWVTGLGAAETIPVQFPVVADPDADTDTHWTTPKTEGADLAITADNTFIAPFSISQIRLKKPVTAADVAVFMEAE